MHQIVSFILITIYSLGLSSSDPSAALAPSIKVKIEHTHEVISGHHHHHDLDNDGGHEDDFSEDHKHDENTEHKQSLPHSHEVSVSIASAVILGSSSIIPVFLVHATGEMYLSAFDETPPKEVSLRSIFRPPIV